MAILLLDGRRVIEFKWCIFLATINPLCKIITSYTHYSNCVLMYESICTLNYDWNNFSIYYDYNILFMIITFETIKSRESEVVGNRFILFQTAISY